MRIITCLLIALIFYNCNKPYIEKPEHLLSQSEMVEIMTDLYITQQLINAVPSHGGNTITEIAKNSVFILDKHQTTSKIFEDSYKYYYSDSNDYSSLMDDVKKNLESKLSEDELKKLKEMNSQNFETIQ